MIRESMNLTGSDTANMLGGDADDAYNSSKAEEFCINVISDNKCSCKI